MKKVFSKYSDKELFELLSADKLQSEQAFGELYSRYSQRIYAYCLRVLGDVNDAKDVYQDAFLKFYHTAQSKKEPVENIYGYLLVITRNLCFNIKRHQRFDFNIEDYQITVSDASYDNKELLDLIAGALDLLEIDTREIFVLRQYHGLSYQEIVDITNEPMSTVRNKFWRAKEKIKTILQPYLNDVQKLM